MALDTTNKNLVVCNAEFLPATTDRNNDTIYFVYDQMAVYVGNINYTEPFCVVEVMPDHPAEGMLYITIDGRLKTFFNNTVVDFGGTTNPEYINLLHQAGTVYFMKAEYRYLDLQTRCIALPYQNGTYQLSVNLMKCIKINNNTVIRYNEETGRFEITGDYADTEFHETDNFEGIETDTVKTYVQNNRVYADVKISDAINNAIKILGSGLYADVSGNVSREEFERLVLLYNNFITTVNGLVDEIYREMDERGYTLTPENIREMILDVMEEYQPTIRAMFENYDMIYEQLGYIREASLDYTDEKFNETKQQITDYLNNITNAWENFTVGDVTTATSDLTDQESAYLAAAIATARADILAARNANSTVSTTPNSGDSDFEYGYIGDGSIDGQQVTPGSLNASCTYGRTVGTTYIYTNEVLESGHFFYYKITDVVPVYEEDAISSGYTRWVNDPDIPCNDGDFIMFVETDSARKILRYGRLVAKVRTSVIETLGTLSIFMVKGSQEGKMTLVVTPALESGNQYSFGELENIPDYNGIVPSGLRSWDGTSDIDFSNDNYKIFTMIEHNPYGFVKKVGTFRVDLASSILYPLQITSVFGAANKSTSLSIYPQKGIYNTYLRAFGAIIPNFNSNLSNDSRFVVWNGGDISCPSYASDITIVECEYDNGYRARKAGSVHAVINNTYAADIAYDQLSYLIDKITDADAVRMAYKSVDDSYSTWYYCGNITSGFTRVNRHSDGTFHIPFELNKKIAIATLDSSNKVVQYNIIDSIIENAKNLNFNVSRTDNKVTLTGITPDSSVSSRVDKYYYQLMKNADGKTYILNEPIDSSLYERWIDGSIIDIVDSSITMIKLVAVSATGGVLAVKTKSI